MSADDEVFTGEYFVSLKGFKIPHKSASKVAPFDVNNPPPPGTEDEDALSELNDSYDSPLATDKRPAARTFEIPIQNATPSPNKPTNSSPQKPTKRSALFMMPTAEGLPEELIKLFKPLCCDLCSAKLNSPSSARLHYESKNHEKKINNWLTTWAEKTGEPVPKRPAMKKGPTGPNALHCDICDLALTSLQHAKQHNMGKKHKNALAGRGKPGGSGYYDSNNKWIRTAKIIEEDPTNRFSIGEAFLVKNSNNTETVVVPESVLETPPPPPPPSPPSQPVEAKPISRPEIKPETKKSKTTTLVSSAAAHPLDKSLINSSNETSLPQSEVILELQPATASQVLDPAKYCKLCDISVTSEMHMRLHLAGAKHAKKLRQLGEPPYSEEPHTISQCIQEESIPIRPKMKVQVNLNANTHVNASANGNATDCASTTTPIIDYSVFRTPSGQYYCQVCDLSVTSEVTLSQHFASKRHLKTTKRK